MNFSLCPYKFLFGKPKESIHKYRIFDIAIIDLLMVILCAILISKYYNYDFKIILTILLLIGIIFHRIFCVETTIDKFLFIK